MNPPKWTVFRGPYPNDDGTNREHVCVVIKTSLHYLHYFYLTSQAKVLQYHKKDPKSVVSLAAAEVANYFAHPESTFIQCSKSSMQVLGLADFQDKVSRDQIQLLSNPLEQHIIDKINTAISESKTYYPEEKAALIK